MEPGKNSFEAFYRQVGQTIRAQRTAQGHKQEVLANYLKMNRISVVNIEKGKQKVQLHTLVEIAAFLNVKVETLIPSSELLHSGKIDSKMSKRLEDQLEQIDDRDAHARKITEFVITLQK